MHVKMPEEWERIGQYYYYIKKTPVRFPDIKLYNQICFYLHLFDVNDSKYKNLLSKHPQGMRDAYDYLKESVEKILSRSGYASISLDTLFGGEDGDEDEIDNRHITLHADALEMSEEEDEVM